MAVKYNVIEMNKKTHIYEPTKEYIEKIYKKASKRQFMPFDKKEFTSTKIMFHKKIPKYNFNSRILKAISKAYNGAGFTIINKNFMFENAKKQDVNCYDVNSAYQASLLKNDFILSSRVKGKYLANKNISLKSFLEHYKNAKYIVYIEFRRLTPKYDFCDYNIFDKQLRPKLYKDKIVKIGWLCDTDLKSLLKLYNFYECKIYFVYKFLNFGKFMELKPFILEKYNKLHSIKDKTERKNYKIMLHIATYGKSAQMSRFDFNVRSKYIVVALYQAAYVRQKMINIFIKYNKDIAYMDTDCVFIKSRAKHKFKIGSNIGEFKLQYEKVRIYINRIKAYALYKNGKRIEFKWSGIQNPLTESQLKKIENGGVIEVIEKRGKKKQKIKICNKFLYGDDIKI